MKKSSITWAVLGESNVESGRNKAAQVTNARRKRTNKQLTNLVHTLLEIKACFTNMHLFSSEETCVM